MSVPGPSPFTPPPIYGRAHFPEDIEREFVTNGFRMDGLYADVAGAPYAPGVHELAVVAGKNRRTAGWTPIIFQIKMTPMNLLMRSSNPLFKTPFSGATAFSLREASNRLAKGDR